MPWFAETLHRSVRQMLAVRRPIATVTTGFQRMQILDTEAYGRALVLDGVVQTTERDEHIYHEMMTHVPLIAHPRPRRVLVIGGGDGGIAREVLRHPTVEAVTMVEIDPDVIKACKRHLPNICGRAFSDRRLQVIVEDGAKFVRTTDQRFDVAIVDSPDPIGPATVLFAMEFYRNVARVLRGPGIMVRQTGSLFLQPTEIVEADRRLRRVFAHVAPYVAAIPTYIGGFFGFLLASNQVQPLRATPAQLETRYRRARLACQYYNPAIHRACFALPASVRARLVPV
ncbi:MAG: spermidine synthase [Omnitrophica WOR_2 bacterium RIFCSPHIGHO2_02_FULL_68_15]|nr:MAG: spermidine synthase [Omnitrophica WOR_2 bacterium RIFCSPHIGHO2_02_FULL_68_15]